MWTEDSMGHGNRKTETWNPDARNVRVVHTRATRTRALPSDSYSDRLMPYYNYNFGFGPDSALARSRNCFLSSFPVALFGIWSMMTTPPLRNLCSDTRALTHSCISLENAADSGPGCGFTLGTTYALDEERQ